MKKIDARERNLNDYLSIDSEVGILTLPFSQRPYEWDKTQIERLFNDLVSLYGMNEDIHMLNFFTLSNEMGNVKKIFDGQQRTITTILIVGAFVKKLDELNEENAAKQLHEKFIIQPNYLTTSTENKQKIKFENPEVQEFFYKLLARDNNDSYIAKNYRDETIKNLINNYTLIKMLLEDFIEENKLKGKEIIELVSTILERTKLITIVTDTDELAMAMFESLNNTGKQLENYYVLKNDLVMILSEEIVKDKWVTIDSNLSNYDPSAFLMTVSTILTGKSTKKNSLERLYKEYNKNSQNDMNALLELLLKASKKYLFIRNPVQINKHNRLKEFPEYKQLIFDVQLFITSQYRPLVLAMLMREMALKEINTVLRHLLNLGIRNFYFKERSANTIEVPIAKLAIDVYKHNFNMEQIVKEIEKIAITDDELKEAIISKNVKGSAEKKLKYILRETYNKIDLDKELEIRNSLNDIHYEHILPQSPNRNSQWVKDFVEEERMLYTTKIGNATLLLEKLNKRNSNKDFKDKIKIYKDSHIPENLVIAQNREWTKKQVLDRTENLSNKIIEYLNRLTKS